MRRFNNILFSPLGLHDNPAALRRVAELAADNGARVTLIGVAPEPTPLQRLLRRSTLVDETTEAERDRYDKLLARLAKDCEAPTSTMVTMGDPSVRIIEQVLANNHDLVVVTTDEDRVDATTIRRLLRRCPCPVWVIRPTRARIPRILAAVNPDPAEIGLNRVILELASSAVQRLGGELHLAHAWDLYGEHTMRHSAFVHVSPDEVDALVKEERGRHKQAIADLLAQCDLADEPWKIHLIKADPAEAIPALVARKRINLLVMGTVARTGLNRIVIGNTAERVLDEVTCSVIAVKPEGFVSPIQAPA